MKDELNTNNSKKLIIGISILFCTVILIIGATTAFFTQSDTKEIGNLVTENINGTLHYDDNNDYMFGNLIPVNEEDVLKFASKDNDICKYQEGMYACNLYEFTITNNSNVSQELIITLNPTINEFGNLYYILLDKNKDDISLDNVPVSNGHINETNSKEIANKVVLGAGSSKTYTIVYYVKNLEDIDQTSMDAGKQFYAKVRVDSITTGTYAGTLMQSKCYEYEAITEGEYAGTYKLTSFNGIDSQGNADSSCGVTKTGDYYSVTVPSKLKDENGNELNVSTLGNMLFVGVDFTDGSASPIAYINNIEIEEGIEIIEDGSEELLAGTFAGIGIDLTTEEVFMDNFEFNIKLPNTLKHLGAYAFWMNQIYTLNIPASVETIGNNVIGDYNTQKFLNELTFEGADTNKSNLISIGDEAFNGIYIENLVIPASVKEIGNKAFTANYNLSKITFMGADTNDSSLETIGEKAFHDARLNYVNEPLVLPSTLTSIGDNAFIGGIDRIGNFQKVLFMGTRTNLNKLGTNWYTSPTVVTANIEE